VHPTPEHLSQPFVPFVTLRLSSSRACKDWHGTGHHLRPTRTQIDQPVPFQDSIRASVGPWPWLLAYSPTALHALAETQDTP